MPELNYRIGCLKINKDRLRFSGPSPYLACHKHVVLGHEDSASIFVAEGMSHREVASQFDLDETRLVGGGSLYLDNEERLVIDDCSMKYGTIPWEAAKKFGELVLAELEKGGISATRVWADPTGVNRGLRERYMFWEDLGFE